MVSRSKFKVKVRIGSNRKRLHVLSSLDALKLPLEMEVNERFYVETPLIESKPLAKTIRAWKVYLKLENTQPSGSFKLRGISHLMLQELKRGKKCFVGSSGGNAGTAAAYTASRLKVPLTLVVPQNTKSETIVKLRNECAQVIVHGEVWNEADKRARELVRDNTTAYIHPFDHKDIWEGHGNIILELANQMKEIPDLIVLSVGGGGLLLGVCNGLEKLGWNNVPILALETVGADSFHQADLVDRVVTLPKITSIATTLAALEVAKEAVKARKRYRITSQVVSDRQAVTAIVRFLDDHRFLVEPSCGATLAAFYSHVISDLQAQGHLEKYLNNVVVIVCGGSGVDLESLQHWKEMFHVDEYLEHDM